MDIHCPKFLDKFDYGGFIKVIDEALASCMLIGLKQHLVCTFDIVENFFIAFGYVYIHINL